MIYDLTKVIIYWMQDLAPDTVSAVDTVLMARNRYVVYQDHVRAMAWLTYEAPFPHADYSLEFPTAT